MRVALVAVLPIELKTPIPKPSCNRPYAPDPTGAVGYQKRDHYPGKDRRGRLKKWVSPKGAAPVLACHPWASEAVRSGTGRLWAVEGATRMLALAERGEAAVSYAGCYTWQKDGVPLEDWRGVNMGRLVYDVPDADARTNWQVQTTQAARVPYFETRGARVLAVRALENTLMQGLALDLEWAAERAAEAMRYLAANCPTSSGSPDLHGFQDAHEAAVSGDRGAYLEALRGYVRAGQRVERRARKGAA